MDKYYLRRNISRLLGQDFTREALSLFCYDHATFSGIYARLTRETDKRQFVELLLDQAERSALMETLLAWAKDHNPEGYERHQPYTSATPTGTEIEARQDDAAQSPAEAPLLAPNQPGRLNPSQRQFLLARLEELRGPLGIYHRRVQALAQDLARELDSERQIILQERLAEARRARSQLQQEIEDVEQQLVNLGVQ